MQEIEKRRLGKTDFEITPIGLGAMEFSGGKGFTKYVLAAVPPATQDEVIKVALDSGMNWIDTAEMYGFGESERAVANGLKAAGKSPGDVLITTKWFPMLARAKSMRKSAKKSTQKLAPYPIDLYLVHRPSSVSSIKTQMNEMAGLVDSGMIRAVGISNFSMNQMIEAHEVLAEHGIPLATNQVHFSLLKRNIETNGVLDTAKDLGVTITAYTPLGMGALTGHFHRNPELLEVMPRFRRSRLRGRLKKTKSLIETLESIALEHEATVAQITLSWTTNYHGETVVAIPGATKTYQAEQNAGAMRIVLSSEQMESISAQSLEL
ncbi:MAG: aldo/keto reductase [Candidatus Thorarchaeota archaeon]|nr:MAG: aldo/keto reductase [Candidatus Thorarchaeota archaeon]